MQKNNVEEIISFDSDNGSHVSLGIDANNYLYVNKKKIATTNIIKFDYVVNHSIILASFSTFGIFVIEILKTLKMIS